MPSSRNFRSVSYYRASGKQEHIDSDMMHRLLADGLHEWRCVSCGKQKGEGACTAAGNHTMALFEIAPENFDDKKLKTGVGTPCSLTFRDMQHLVGIVDGEWIFEPPLRLVLRARRKVANWGEASRGNRAVTVVHPASLGPGRAFSC